MHDPTTDSSISIVMTKLIGKVTPGMGMLSEKMKTVPGLLEGYYKKTGLHLFPGSLNIKLVSEFSVPVGAIRFEQEDKDSKLWVNLIPCKFKDTEAFIVRTDKAERGEGKALPKNIIEILSDVKLRDAYKLQDGDEIEITIK